MLVLQLQCIISLHNKSTQLELSSREKIHSSSAFFAQRYLNFFVACAAGVKGVRGRGNLDARGRKERNACKDAIVFSIFHAQLLSVKIVIG